MSGCTLQMNGRSPKKGCGSQKESPLRVFLGSMLVCGKVTFHSHLKVHSQTTMLHLGRERVHFHAADGMMEIGPFR